MRTMIRTFLLCFVLSFFALAAIAQKPEEILLTVNGEVSAPVKITRADFEKLPRKTVRAKDHDGKEYNYEGVAVIDILQKAGVKFGDALRGKALATYLLVQAADGYQAVYALPELDAPAADRVILIADRQDGVAFSANVGPLKIIVPGDRTHSRWVRQLRTLSIVRAPAAQ